MANEIEISVIIPVFNSANSLPALITNLRSQESKNIEFLLIDDGSTDSSTNIIDNAVKSDARFRLVKCSHFGTGRARNFGIKLARGNYVFFLDADDAIAAPDALSKLLATARNLKVDICGGSIRFVKRGKCINSMCHWDSDVTFSSTGYEGLAYEPFEYFSTISKYDYSKYQYDAGFTRFIYSKELLLNSNVLFPEGRYFEDPVFFTRAMHAAGTFGTIPDPVYIYNIGWHPIIRDEAYYLETLNGLISNYEFALENDYKQLQLITRYRFTRYSDLDLIINDNNYELLKGAVEKTWQLVSGLDTSLTISELPECVRCVRDYKTPKWNSPKSVFSRGKRKAKDWFVNYIKRGIKALQSLLASQ